MENLINSFQEKIENSIDSAIQNYNWNGISILPEKLQSLRGYSPKETRVFLNNLMDENSRYLEIGLHRGASFFSALYLNNLKTAIGIDNFGGPVYDDLLKYGLLDLSEEFDLKYGIDYDVIFDDCYNLKEKEQNKLKKLKFNVYYYDGPHNKNDHIKSLVNYAQYMDDVFIFLVNDWFYPPVSEGTKIGIDKSGVTVLKEWILGESEEHKSEEIWKNGLYVSIVQNKKSDDHNLI
jgi:hypothetical protein